MNDPARNRKMVALPLLTNVFHDDDDQSARAAVEWLFERDAHGWLQTTRARFIIATLNANVIQWNDLVREMRDEDSRRLGGRATGAQVRPPSCACCTRRSGSDSGRSGRAPPYTPLCPFVLRRPACASPRCVLATLLRYVAAHGPAEAGDESGADDLAMRALLGDAGMMRHVDHSVPEDPTLLQVGDSVMLASNVDRRAGFVKNKAVIVTDLRRLSVVLCLERPGGGATYRTVCRARFVFNVGHNCAIRLCRRQLP
jgi:hypothetical protein